MCRSFVRWLRGRAVSFSMVSLVLSLCAVASCPVSAWAAGGAEAKICAALSQPTTLIFIETPLGDVADYLKALHKIDVQLDERALRDKGSGVSADSSISREHDGTTLHSALRLVLSSTV